MDQIEMPVYVLITEPFAAGIVDRLNAVSERLELHFLPARKVEDLPTSTMVYAEVLYTLAAVPQPEEAPNLKWVQFHFAGLDRFAGHPLLKAGVEFTSLSGASAPQIAEYVLMMMLSLGHCLPDLQAAQAAQEWARDRWERFTPRELRGATVGVIGYGSVGREVTRLCHSFGARVLAVKRNLMQMEDTGYTIAGLGDPEGRIPARVYPPSAIRRMLGECDFVVLSAPLTGETRMLFDGETIGAMRDGAYLVDISRGGIVAEDALVEALRSGKLAGAALDVFAREPLPAKSPLWSAPNLLLSPHIAGDSRLYDERAADLFAENLRRYLEGRPLWNRFEPGKGY